MTPEEFERQREIIYSEIYQNRIEIDYLEEREESLEKELDDLYREYIDGKNE